MINTHDVLETIDMIRQENLDIRTITMGISLWDCENPNLYRVRVTLADGATAEVNIGLRHIRFDADRGFFLNGKNMKLKGVCVHQGHGGIGVAEFDGMHEYKIKKLKEMGANAYRTSHSPVTPALLDACDRLGMLVMQDMVNSGPYHFLRETALPTFGFKTAKDTTGTLGV